MKKFNFSLLLLLIAGIAGAQNRNVLIEKYAATWCGYCPAATIEMDSLMQVNPRIIGLSTHYNDAMEIQDGRAATQAYVEAFPGSTIDRVKFNTESKLNVFYQNWEPLLEERLNTPSPVTVAGTAVYASSTNTINIDLTVNVVENITGEVRVNAYILEDSVTGGSQYNQRNYYFNNDPNHPYLYQAGDPILNYVHNHVLRAMAGGAFGAGNYESPTAGSEISHSFSVDVDPNWSLEHLKVIFLAQAYSSELEQREILNAERGEIDMTSAIDRQTLTNYLVYPNPVQSTFTIGTSTSKQIEVHLYDVLGKELKLGKSNFQTPALLELPANIQAGTYLLEIKEGNSINRIKINKE